MSSESRFDPSLVLIKDRFRLQRQWREIAKGCVAEKDVEKFWRATLRSMEVRATRLQAMPQVRYPDNLPVVDKLEEIKKAISENQVVIIAGETGSGKTTQLPKICLDLGRGVDGLIGHTQPRRLAARSVANRIAEELSCEVGKQVGYQVRFTDHTDDSTLVKLMTDGILLAETQNDRFLNRYDTIIIDEAHERSLNIDFLIGYLKNLLPKRPDLKVIITSATIDLDRFSEHFSGAPVVEVSGRTYPVELHYRPLTTMDDEVDIGLQDGVVHVVREIEKMEREQRKPPGDILIFMVGEREIRETAQRLRKEEFRNTEILPLYARLSNQEQNRIFQSHGGRRIVVSTNVAETSLTVPGIRYVIDPGQVRISRYSYRSKVQRLPIEAISQASAEQRKGRCGRVSEGVCFRLYSEEDFVGRDPFTDPEILRTNLASVILQMLSLRLGDIQKFPFMQKPDKRYINDGYKLLEELGAVNAQRQMTAIGRTLARFPIDPRLARMLVAAAEGHCLKEMLIIVSALAVQDPRERPMEFQQAADEKHAQWADEQSDFVSLLNLWNGYEAQRQELSANQLRNYCKKNFLSFLRMREWRDTHRQLLLLCHEQSYKENTEPAAYDELHQALLAGLITQIGQKDEKGEYAGPRQRKFVIFPGSKVRKKAPNWIMSAEVVETSRLFARTVARMEPGWIEKVAPQLLKSSYLEPHWSKKRGEALAFQQVSLYGLIVVPRRQVSYGRIDPQFSREALIREGLIEGEINSRLPFILHNAECREEVEQIEAKARRRDLLVDDEVLFQFYDEQLPADITTVKGLEYWYKRLSDGDKKALLLSPEALLRVLPEVKLEEQFPDALLWNGQQFQLSYKFEPGAKDDGVTVRMPAAAMAQAPVGLLDWLAPGMRKEKCEALIRSLPKAIRKNFVPVPDFAKAASDAMAPDNHPMSLALGEQLRKMTGMQVAPEQWDESLLPPHLRMNIQVVDSQGGVIDQGRDYHELVKRLEGRLEKLAQESGTLFKEQTGLTEWSFGAMQEKVAVSQAGASLFLYPYLQDQGTSVALKSAFDAGFAQAQHRLGMARLIMLKLADTVKYLKKNLPKLKEIGLYYAPTGKLDGLVDELALTACIEVFLKDKPAIANADEFNRRVQQYKADLIPKAEELALLLHEILQGYHRITKSLSKSTVLALAMFLGDVKRQLQHLVYPGFLTEAPLEWLRQYPRYLAAIEERLDKMPRQITLERQFQLMFETLWSQYNARKEKHQREGYVDEELANFRWMLEEFRVSYFAQKLGTLMSVSEKKLQKQWEKVRI
ncbi:ATP-dependent RNA helicase HrpA [Hahella sp. KA22]|uniref:ATP-dependent RNA helicase HrpA n=1 Tax=Hahella sp. KA22 TaxID=1628392 RepID=UPI000FDE07A6|nr:ATP-dependent RNA helicase HrpA [Hahella sp. KA22]AZZ93064.1 ATP-dependent RNA helicase HrpA [Hahella sp. KA22]QAY56438.1 ATP-dependent RNA helicase HrpA [Hahella sp. KA22]